MRRPAAIRRVGQALIGALWIVGSSTVQVAYGVDPAQVVASLSTAEVREFFDIVTVGRDVEIPRLLVVRVGAGWSTVSVLQRKVAAERWQRIWRRAVADGVVAVLDITTGAPVVFFDAERKAIVGPGGSPDEPI